MNRNLAAIIILVCMIIGGIFGLYAIVQITLMSAPTGEIIPSISIVGVSLLVYFVVGKNIAPSPWISCSFCRGPNEPYSPLGRKPCPHCGGTGRIPRPKD